MSDAPTCVIHRSNVNAWECDENGHLNVRFYIAKTFDGIVHLLADAGITPAWLATRDARVVPRSQHVRYLREARVATPFVGVGRIVRHAAHRVTVYSELRDSMDDTVYTTFTTDVEIVDGSGAPVTAVVDPAHCEPVIPDYGAVRSLPPEGEPQFDVDAALAAGYVETGRGTVRVDECDRGGRLEPYQFAARIADAIPNFMGTMQSAEEFALRASGELGGAVIESRADYFADVPLGHRLVVLSGLRSFGEKTMRLTHLVFDLDADVLAFHSQGIAVALDLKARRAVPFAPDRMERMQKRLVDVT